MCPAASQFPSLHSHSLRLILAAASMKVKREGKTLQWMYKGNIHPRKRRFIMGSYTFWTAVSFEFALKRSWRNKGNFLAPLRTTTQSSVLISLQYEKTEISVDHKRMMLCCSYITRFKNMSMKINLLKIVEITTLCGISSRSSLASLNSERPKHLACLNVHPTSFKKVSY